MWIFPQKPLHDILYNISWENGGKKYTALGSAGWCIYCTRTQGNWGCLGLLALCSLTGNLHWISWCCYLPVAFWHILEKISIQLNAKNHVWQEFSLEFGFTFATNQDFGLGMSHFFSVKTCPLMKCNLKRKAARKYVIEWATPPSGFLSQAYSVHLSTKPGKGETNDFKTCLKTKITADTTKEVIA